MADRPAWIRSAVSLLVFVGVGAVVLAATAWLVVRLLPGGEQVAEDYGVEIDVSEVGEAAPGDVAVQIDRCEVVDGVVEAGGRVRNASDEAQAFVLHLAVLIDDRLFDGTTVEVAIPTLRDGNDRGWSSTVGAVDPDGSAGPITCEIDRVGLGEELVD